MSSIICSIDLTNYDQIWLIVWAVVGKICFFLLHHTSIVPTCRYKRIGDQKSSVWASNFYWRTVLTMWHQCHALKAWRIAPSSWMKLPISRKIVPRLISRKRCVLEEKWPENPIPRDSLYDSAVCDMVLEVWWRGAVTYHLIDLNHYYHYSLLFCVLGQRGFGWVPRIRLHWRDSRHVDKLTYIGGVFGHHQATHIPRGWKRLTPRDLQWRVSKHPHAY